MGKRRKEDHDVFRLSKGEKRGGLGNGCTPRAPAALHEKKRFLPAWHEKKEGKSTKGKSRSGNPTGELRRRYPSTEKKKRERWLLSLLGGKKKGGSIQAHTLKKRERSDEGWQNVSWKDDGRRTLTLRHGEKKKKGGADVTAYFRKGEKER